jgi:putative tryptophan/tyrosine transport system substrate-binding protein
MNRRDTVPSAFMAREFPEAGGFMSYGSNYADSVPNAARYVDRILKGAKPGDLPVKQASKFELVLNLKTAREIGRTVPQSLLIRVDRVIQ